MPQAPELRINKNIEIDLKISILSYLFLYLILTPEAIVFININYLV
jgi:hypothetical protein